MPFTSPEEPCANPGEGATAVAATAVAASPAAADTAADGTFARIRTTKKLRIAGIAGTEPYYHKDIASGAWSGFCIAMGNDLAHSMEAEAEVVETTWGNAVLDLQAGKIDVAFGRSPPPAPARAVDLSRPLLENTFTVIAKPGFEAAAWADLDKPETRVAVDIGSTHDSFARRVLPHATLVALKTPDDAMLAVQAGRADCVIQVVLLALVSVKKNPRLGRMIIPTPLIQQPTCVGMRVDADGRFRSFVDAWLEYNKSLGVVRGWITDGLRLVGVAAADVPADVQL